MDICHKDFEVTQCAAATNCRFDFVLQPLLGAFLKPPALPVVMTSSSGASIIFGVNAGCSIGGSLENHVKQIADKDDGRSHNTKEGKQ